MTFLTADQIAARIEDLPFRLFVIGKVAFLKKMDVEITPERLEKIIADEQETYDRRKRPERVVANARLSKDGRSVEVEKPCVYYIRMGNLVKIGTTTNLRSRMSALSPEQILATEDGWYGLEKQRHRQFHHLHNHGEWFRYEGDLVEHIAALRRRRR